MTKPEVRYGLETSFGSIYGDEERRALEEVLRAGAPSSGKVVREFEERFAAYCGCRHAVAVTSATAGLTLSGIAAGVGPGDEVITTPISWVATATAFSTLGADIVFADVDPHMLTLDPESVERRITPRTKAIVPVHLYGQCAAMDRLRALAEGAGSVLIEDCAHNPGGEYLGRKAGSLGDMGVFSFHQQKNMSTLGEGGMVTTDDPELFERLYSYRSLCCRTYSDSTKYLPLDESARPMGRDYWWLEFDDIGRNFRMTDAAAAVGIVQLGKLDSNNRKRQALAARLTDRLRDLPSIELPATDPKGTHVYHLYVIQLRDGFPMSKRDFMWELYVNRGIKVWNHYIPIHLTTPYARLGHRGGECPVAEAAFERYVSLPIHPRLTNEAIDYMADSIRELAGT